MKKNAIDPVEPVMREPTLSVEDRPIGRILIDMGKLRPRDADWVFNLHRELGMKFGEAARKLKLVKDADVQQALSVQFNYPHLNERQSVLGPELIAAHAPFQAQAEALRDLRTQLLLHWANPERKVLAIVSVNARDGRTFVAANLAVVFAQLGEKTLLIDADLRQPRQHRLFGHGGPGLAQALSGRPGIELAERVSYFENLWLLTAGATPPNPLELLSRPEFPKLLAEARRRFTVVVVDTPASLRGSDARLVAARSDGVLAVVRQDRTRIADLEALCRAASASGVQVAGTIFNRN
ncbi:MAG: polysaccharide biosynthesis tyrosine autokinase [Burkholderiales bacterium]